MHSDARPGHLTPLVRHFLRLGFLGCGGPVALVGQMERELVSERRWLTAEQIREAIAGTLTRRPASPAALAVLPAAPAVVHPTWVLVR